MTGILYALNVGTLAVWTSVAGAGIVGLVATGGDGNRPKRDLSMVIAENKGEGEFIDMEEPSGSPEPGPAADEEPADPMAPPEEVAPPETLPELPAAEFEPLPEIPELPDLPPRPAVKPAVASTTPPSDRPKPPSANRNTNRSGGQPSTSGRTGNGSGSGNGQGPGPGMGTGSGTGKGGGGAQRLSKGNFPKPAYPQACKDAGQSGTVVIRLTVDESGAVILAKIAKPCPFSALNEAALNAARRAKFPSSPGAGVVSANKPYKFNLTDG